MKNIFEAIDANDLHLVKEIIMASPNLVFLKNSDGLIPSEYAKAKELWKIMAFLKEIENRINDANPNKPKYKIQEQRKVEFTPVLKGMPNHLANLISFALGLGAVVFFAGFFYFLNPDYFKQSSWFGPPKLPQVVIPTMAPTQLKPIQIRITEDVPEEPPEPLPEPKFVFPQVSPEVFRTEVQVAQKKVQGFVEFHFTFVESGPGKYLTSLSSWYGTVLKGAMPLGIFFPQ